MNKDTNDTVKTVKDDVRDGVDEAKNRAQATGERLTREAQGDTMPLGERITSHVKETAHNVAANVDKAKRDLRHAGDAPNDEPS